MDYLITALFVPSPSVVSILADFGGNSVGSPRAERNSIPLTSSLLLLFFHRSPFAFALLFPFPSPPVLPMRCANSRREEGARGLSPAYLNFKVFQSKIMHSLFSRTDVFDPSRNFIKALMDVFRCVLRFNRVILDLTNNWFLWNTSVPKLAEFQTLR